MWLSFFRKSFWPFSFSTTRDKTLLDNIQRAVHFLPGDGQRRSQREDISHAHFETQSSFQRLIHHALGLLGGAFTSRAVFQQFNPEQQPQSPAPADQWMPLLHLL